MPHRRHCRAPKRPVDIDKPVQYDGSLMTALRTVVTEQRPTDRQLRYAAAGLAYIVAILHLFHPKLGLPRLIAYVSIGQPFLDPRPAAFVLSGGVIMLAVILVALGAPRKPIYLLGMLLMLTYLVGYFAWHYTGHGGFLPGREAYGHGELGPLENVVVHLADDWWARASKLAETILFGILALLYYRES